MTAFTAERAADLNGPDWLVSRRSAAATRFASADLPTADEEVWRYSRIGELDLAAWEISGGSGAIPAAARDVTAELDPAGLVVTVDGRLASVTLDMDLANKGVFVGRLTDSDHGQEALGSLSDDETDDAFVALNDAFSADPILVHVPEGVIVDRPIAVVHWVSTAGLASFPRLIARTGPAAEVNILEYFGSDDVSALVVPLTELSAGRDSRLGLLTVQDLGLDVWQIGRQISRVDGQATLTSATAGIGADYGRMRLDCQLAGRGATGNLIAIYFGRDDQTLDFRTHQDHREPDCTSDLLFKGALDDQAKSVYTGMIKVRPGAKGTNAFQTNRNIKLSDDAWAESVPNLEIENNDVKCSHASTVGPIDLDQRFYLESRGVPPEVAERLVVKGFFSEVLQRLPVPAMADHLETRLTSLLEMEPS